MNLPTGPSKAQATPSLKWVFYALGAGSILVCIAVGFIFFTVWLPLKSYISNKPFAIEYFPTSSQGQSEVRQKISRFWNSDSGDTLGLSSLEINNLLAANQLLKEYDVKYRIELQDSLFNLRCVVPARKIKNKMVSIIKFINVNGYINAEMEGLIFLEGQNLFLASTRSQINSRPAPFTLLGKRSRIELNQFFPDVMMYKNTVEKLESVYIRNGRLFIVRKS